MIWLKTMILMENIENKIILIHNRGAFIHIKCIYFFNYGIFHLVWTFYRSYRFKKGPGMSKKIMKGGLNNQKKMHFISIIGRGALKDKQLMETN